MSKSNSEGSASSPAAKICWRPIVTTVRISRGDFANRRMTATSVTAPSASGGDEADERGREVWPVRPDDQRCREHRGEPTDVTLREVDDPVRPVDQHEAHGDEGREGTEDQPEEENGDRCRVDDEDEDEDGRARRRDAQPEAGLAVVARSLERAFEKHHAETTASSTGVASPGPGFQGRMLS